MEDEQVEQNLPNTDSLEPRGIDESKEHDEHHDEFEFDVEVPEALNPHNNKRYLNLFVVRTLQFQSGFLELEINLPRTSRTLERSTKSPRKCLLTLPCLTGVRVRALGNTVLPSPQANEHLFRVTRKH